MSIIVHGPQGCGKTINAPLLLKAFKLGRTLEEYDEGFPRDLYHAWTHQPHRGALERKRLLILTCEAPPAELANDPRVLSFDRAMFLARGHKTA